MEFKNLAFILFCITIFLRNTQQKSSQTLIMDHLKGSIEFEELLLGSLNFLQQKLANGTFSDLDMRMLVGLKQFIFKMKENLEKQRIKEQTVYWLLRQGR